MTTTEHQNDAHALLDSGLDCFDKRLNLISSKDIIDRIIFTSDMLTAMRAEANRLGLVEVDLPILEQPCGEYHEGDENQFWVIDPKNPPLAYALRQSPQVQKQALCYATKLDHFRVAANFRSAETDRTHLACFNQLDVELANSSGKQAMSCCEAIIRFLMNEQELGPFKTRRYADILRLYGTDTPDLHHGIEICELTNGNLCLMLTDLKTVRAVQELLSNQSLSFSLNKAKNLQRLLRQFKPDEITDNHILLMLPGFDTEAVRQLRTKLIQKGFSEKRRQKYTAYWLTDMPFAVYNDDGIVVPCHHVMSLPSEEIIWGKADLTKVECDSFDLLLVSETDTLEIAGGDARIYSENQQRQALKALNMTDEEIQRRYAFLLQALKFNDEYQQVQTAGFAFGVERLAMILTGAETIDMVSAFPANNGGPVFTCHAVPVDISKYLRSILG